MHEQENERRVYRLPPCPAYDVEGMESWLSDLAEKGLLLAEDGFFAGVAAFQRTEPQPARYRLEAALRPGGLLSEDGGEPDADAVELSTELGWRYVARRGDFFIYRCQEPGVRELNTDPEVQALAVNAVGKRRRGAMLSTALWLIVYVLLNLRGNLLLLALEFGTPRCLLAALLLIWFCAGGVAEAVYLGRLAKKLRAGEAPDRRKNWRARRWLHLGGKAARTLLLAVLLVGFLRCWSDSILEEDRLPLSRYPGSPPFADMTALAGGQAAAYEQHMLGRSFNTYRTWADPLFPQSIAWSEQATVTRPDGTVLAGGLYVDYHVARSPRLARLLAGEYARKGRWEKGYAALEVPALDADYACAWTDQVHFPTLVLQKGELVVRVLFYQYQSNDYALDAETWMTLMADSLR